MDILNYLGIENANLFYVVIGCLLIGASTALVGCFSVLNKKALIGDAVAHSVLPGICLAFLLFETKNPFILLCGAFITGWLSIILVDVIIQNSRIKTDAAIGIVLSAFFGGGILLLTYIQHSGNAAQSGLDHFLFGQAAAMVGQDVYLFLGMSIFLIIIVAIFFQPFRLIIFDQHYAEALGMPVKRYEILLSSITVLAVTVGIQSVGVVLMAALLITPAVAARSWTDNLKWMLAIAAFVGAFASVVGAYISLIAPSMPTGPWVIVVLTMLGLFSVLFAPQRGILVKKWKQRRNFSQILEENVLKLLYQLEEKDPREGEFHTKQDMLIRRDMGDDYLSLSLRRLVKKTLIKQEGDNYRLTKEGRKIGKRMVKIHRLYELYLTDILKLPSDHVHETAEYIEHVLTPELEIQLEAVLGYPTEDPHNSPIPY